MVEILSTKVSVLKKLPFVNELAEQKLMPADGMLSLDEEVVVGGHGREVDV